MDDELAEFLLERKMFPREVSIYCSNEVYYKYFSKFRKEFIRDEEYYYDKTFVDLKEYNEYFIASLSTMGVFRVNLKTPSDVIKIGRVSLENMSFIEESIKMVESRKNIDYFMKDLPKEVYIKNKHKTRPNILKYAYSILYESDYCRVKAACWQVFCEPETFKALFFNKKLTNVEKYKILKFMRNIGDSYAER